MAAGIGRPMATALPAYGAAGAAGAGAASFGSTPIRNGPGAAAAAAALQVASPAPAAGAGAAAAGAGAGGGVSALSAAGAAILASGSPAASGSVSARMDAKASAAKPAAEKTDDKEAALDKKDALKRRTQLSVDIKGRAATEVFCVQYSPDSRFLACGCGDGSIRIFGSGGKLLYTLSNLTATNATANLPTTTIRFRPPTATAKSKNSVLIAGSTTASAHRRTAAAALRWHMTAQACLYSIEEEDNQVYALDYRRDGEMFATAGRDTKIRLYEEATKTLLRTMTAGASSGKANSSKAGATGAGSGHSNRIYCVKYKPTDPNVLVSGGWDNTIQIWDTRVGSSVRSIFGPHICGDAVDLDANGDVLLTGSWRPDNALQLWDLGTGKLLDTIEWAKKLKGKAKDSDMIYSAAFSPSNDLIAAGGSGTNDARVFEYDTQKKYRCLERVKMPDTKGVYTVAFSPNGRKLAVAGADKNVTVVDVK